MTRTLLTVLLVVGCKSSDDKAADAFSARGKPEKPEKRAPDDKRPVDPQPVKP